MRRFAVSLIAVFCLLGGPLQAGAQPQTGTALPPHAWLFGSWTGGIFPPPSSLPGPLCLSNPTFIVTRDVVLRAVVTDLTYAQREIETVRAGPTGAEFKFVAGPSAAPSPLGLAAPSGEVGFGCENADVLHVVKRGENEIMFPGCADFPYPLIRCSSR
jgi:hypothetical protein